MKQLLIGLLLMVFHITLMGQSTIAKIKYEQAEEAYNNGNLREALIKLDETEQLLGSINPKILYLRIMTQKLLLEKGNYSFGLLDSLRKNTVFYIKNYESNTAVEDKFREVFIISELLTKYPGTKEEYDKIELAKKEKEEKVKALKLSNLQKVNRFVDSLLSKYKYKPGISFEQNQKNNPEGLSGLIKYKLNENLYYRPLRLFGAYYPKGISYIKLSTYDNIKKIDTLCVIVERTKNIKEKDLIFQNWDRLIRSNIPSEYLVIVTKSDSINNYVYLKKTTYSIYESENIPVGISIEMITQLPDYDRIEIIFSNALLNKRE